MLWCSTFWTCGPDEWHRATFTGFTGPRVEHPPVLKQERSNDSPVKFFIGSRL